MRSQGTKSPPKKGALSKTTLKTSSGVKQAKRKPLTPKKVKTLIKKSAVKKPKKNSNNDNAKKDEDSSASDKNESSPENTKSGPSKNVSRSNSPTKKPKKDPKEKKEASRTKTEYTAKKTGAKKVIKSLNKEGAKTNDGDSDEIKYKINIDAAKKTSPKFSKAKTIVRKTNHQNKKGPTLKKPQVDQKVDDQTERKTNKEDDSKVVQVDNNIDTTDNKVEPIKEIELNNVPKIEENKQNIIPEVTASSKINSNPPAVSQPITPKTEHERPPKFFTSSRSPRTVDIDIKCMKTSKGTLSMSERFVSLKCEEKEKTCTNSLVAQGPEIDVYTFTEKVDSPKSILSDFRNPINKNVGRVRPIARVKGTVIDKKDSEKKKYSPHRPIEEVVKQLKANKRPEEFLKSNQNNTLSDTTPTSSDKEEDKPKPIVSKSYKMVARKSSVTGKPFSPIKFPDQEPLPNKNEKSNSGKKTPKSKKPQRKSTMSDDELETCKFALNTTFNYSSSEESVGESNDDNDTKESSESDTRRNKKTKNRKYKRITDTVKKTTSKELKELSKDSLVDLKDEMNIFGGDKPSKRRLKLLSMWTGPKKHRMASLNAMAKVHCLYENESRTHMELGLMRTIERQPIPSTSKTNTITKAKDTKPKESEKLDSSTSESEYENRKDNKKDESSESSDDNPPQRSLRGVPGIRSAGKYWDPKSSSSSEDSEMESKKKPNSPEKKKTTTKTQSSNKSDSDSKPPAKMKKTAGVPVKKKRNRNEVVMDLKDMVVQKRMASLNATAILAASYEKRSPKSTKDDTTSDSCSDESFSQKSKNGAGSGVKSEVKNEDTKKECEDTKMTDRKQKVEVIVNQDTDVTITGVYSTHHHEGFCTVSGMQYRISSTSHTQTTATAEKEGCSRDEARYTPLSALSSMKPPADHPHGHPHPVPELGGLARRAAGCSAFSAPSPSAHHDPGYYQPAGPLIKESGPEAERALARYHPPPHYHPAPHPPVLQQYGPPYYPADLCYRYYRPPGPPYHMPPQSDAQMVGVSSEPYPPPPQYYGNCYQHHSPQRIPYEYRGCPCPLNAFPKNVLIGPATGKAPAGGGPADVPSALAPPGGAFLAKVRACAMDTAADTHGSGKDPPLELEPPAAADAPHPCPLPAIGGASPKRELFDVRDNLRLAGDLVGPPEALGPPSPARGSAGACAPQPPPSTSTMASVPRRARLGKAMARRSLAGDDTGLLLTVPQPPPAHHSDADDDVMAISPPTCAPIDLSSSDERSTPLVDVKKENEGPTCATFRKPDQRPDALALREQNSTTTVSENSTDTNADAAKPAKRRYSRPKLEIDMKDTQLEESLQTNGIGEHVKLQKRRKVSSDQTSLTRTETVTKEPKKRSPVKRTPKTPSEKKTTKRKSDNGVTTPKAKKMLMNPTDDKSTKLPSYKPEDAAVLKPKTKSALLLDNLIRKNSIDRDTKEINPAELFLSPSESSISNTAKKTVKNINNNIVENNQPVSGVRPNTIAAVSQLIEKKLAYKNACKLEKIDSNITHNLKSVLKPPNDTIKTSDDFASLTSKCKSKSEKMCKDSEIKSISIIKDKGEGLKDNVDDLLVSVSDNRNSAAVEDALKSLKVFKTKPKSGIKNEVKPADESHTINKSLEITELGTKEGFEETVDDMASDLHSDQINLYKLPSNKTKPRKSIEKVAKLLVSKKPVVAKTDETCNEKASDNKLMIDELTDLASEKSAKIGKVNGDLKTKSIERVAKLLVSKKYATSDTNNIAQEEKESKRTSIDVVDAITDKTVPEKTLPKRCKLVNGEMKAKNVEKVVKLLVSKKPAIKTDEATTVIEDACASPGPHVGRRAKRRRSGAGTRRARRALAPLAPPALELRAPPRWSNGWQWDGENYISKVYLNNDSRLDRTARCYTRMTHASGDSVGRGDCVLLRASTARAQPFVARIASLWENPEDGEMMVSLVWYYRPEHTERGREPHDAPDEVFASRHRDANSVACIEDKCYVLTFNEYCRYRKRLKAQEEGVKITPSIVPALPPSEVTPAVAPNDSKLPPGVSPELVLFCRKIYDFRSKKIQVPNK